MSFKTSTGVTLTSVKYGATALTKLYFETGGVKTHVWSASTGTTYRWQKSYVAQTIYYTWRQYQLIDNGYYAEYAWSSPSPAGFSDIEGYTSVSFSSTGGYSYSGYGMAMESSSQEVYVGDGTSVTKYWGSGGVLYSSYKSCRWISQYAMGSQLGEVQSTVSNAYPQNGNGGDGYWYIYDRQTTVFSRGADIEIVTSTSQTAHNTTAGGAKEADGYWYLYIGTA